MLATCATAFTKTHRAVEVLEGELAADRVRIGRQAPTPRPAWEAALRRPYVSGGRDTALAGFALFLRQVGHAALQVEQWVKAALCAAVDCARSAEIAAGHFSQ